MKFRNPFKKKAGSSGGSSSSKSSKHSKLSGNKCDSIWEKIEGEKATFGASLHPPWHLSAKFGCMKRVIRCVEGYCGGIQKHPKFKKPLDYKYAVQVEFDRFGAGYGYEELLAAFWDIRDREKENSPAREFTIYYHSPEQKAKAEASKAEHEGKDGQRLVDIEEFKTWVEGEKEHQHELLQHNAKVMKHLKDLIQPHQMAHSHLAARLEGYLEGYGTLEQFDAEQSQLYLPPRIAKRVRKVIQLKEGEKNNGGEGSVGELYFDDDSIDTESIFRRSLFENKATQFKSDSTDNPSPGQATQFRSDATDNQSHGQSSSRPSSDPFSDSPRVIMPVARSPRLPFSGELPGIEPHYHAFQINHPVYEPHRHYQRRLVMPIQVNRPNATHNARILNNPQMRIYNTEISHLELYPSHGPRVSPLELYPPNQLVAVSPLRLQRPDPPPNYYARVVPQQPEESYYQLVYPPGQNFSNDQALEMYQPYPNLVRLQPPPPEPNYELVRLSPPNRGYNNEQHGQASPNSPNFITIIQPPPPQSTNNYQVVGMPNAQVQVDSPTSAPPHAEPPNSAPGQCQNSSRPQGHCQNYRPAFGNRQNYPPSPLAQRPNYPYQNNQAQTRPNPWAFRPGAQQQGASSNYPTVRLVPPEPERYGTVTRDPNDPNKFNLKIDLE